MENELLDHEDSAPKKSSHADKSIWAFIYSIGGYIAVAIFSGSLRQGGSAWLSYLVGIIFIIVFINSINGFRNGILSFTKKENEAAKKYIGTIGNFLIILLYVLSIGLVAAFGYMKSLG